SLVGCFEAIQNISVDAYNLHFHIFETERFMIYSVAFKPRGRVFKSDFFLSFPVGVFLCAIDSRCLVAGCRFAAVCCKNNLSLCPYVVSAFYLRGFIIIFYLFPLAITGVALITCYLIWLFTCLFIFLFIYLFCSPEISILDLYAVNFSSLLLFFAILFLNSLMRLSLFIILPNKFSASFA
uniref:Uncharacterized protein n=1 Tax=Parascaris univalens TaxID=6257 RepID=A0A915BDC6_PARUN